MFLSIFKETVKKVWRNRKNRLVLILSVIGIFVYMLLYLPGTEHMATIDTEKLHLELEAERGMKESRLADGEISVNSFTGVDTYSLAKMNFENHYTYYSAITDGDMARLMELTASGLPQFTAEAVSEMLNERYDGEVQTVDYHRTVMLDELRGMAEMEDASTHLLNQKTAIQQMHIFFKGFGPLIMLLVTVFVASEVLVDDRKHRTLKAGQPIGWRKYILYQSISMFLIILGGMAVLLSLMFLVNGILYGFGSFDLKVSDYGYSDGYRGYIDNFKTQTAGGFILMSLALITLLIYLFIRINAVLSLLFRQDAVVMIVGFLLVLFNRIYSGGGQDTILGIGAEYFPQNYFEFGPVLSGERNFMAMSDAFTFPMAIAVLSATILIVEIILFLTAGWMDRQKFEREVG